MDILLILISADWQLGDKISEVAGIVRRYDGGVDIVRQLLRELGVFAVTLA